MCYFHTAGVFRFVFDTVDVVDNRPVALVDVERAVDREDIRPSINGNLSIKRLPPLNYDVIMSISTHHTVNF